MDSTKGFTLIELVIAIAIIAVLSAIIVPRFTGTTERSRLKADIQSTRIFQNAIDLYEAENGTLPGGATAEAVMQSLVNSGYLASSAKVQTADAKWAYHNGTVSLDVSNCTGETETAIKGLNSQELGMLTGVKP